MAAWQFNPQGHKMGAAVTFAGTGARSLIQFLAARNVIRVSPGSEGRVRSSATLAPLPPPAWTDGLPPLKRRHTPSMGISS
jgi:hypothetical protein